MELRMHERVNFDCRVDLTSPGNENLCITRSINLSRGGVGLISPALLDFGHLVALDFHLKDESGQGVVERITGRIVYALAKSDENILGVQFSSLLSDAAQPRLMRHISMQMA